MFTHTTDTNTNGVRRVWSSLEHYGDLEKNPIQHLRLLLDTTTFLKSYLTVEKPIKKGRKKMGSPVPPGERERNGKKFTLLQQCLWEQSTEPFQFLGL